ncbi:MAG TPA: VWA domain-containing protein, partial [Vicinamibacterales bacterium]
MMTNLVKTHISARAHLIAGAILICLVAALRAQSASPQAPPPTFRAGTALVQVDVVVRDGKGNFVDNLNKGDFRILEDGKPQTVETFTLVGAPGTAARAAQRGSAATQPAGLPSVVRPPTRPMFIFVFDDEHIEPGGFKNVQKAAEDFLQSHFTGNAIGGVVSSRGMANNRLTSSRDELLKDIQGLKPRGTVLFQKYDLREWPRLLGLEEAEQIANGNSEVLSAAVLRAGREEPQGRQSEDPTAAVLEKARQITTEARPATDRLLSTLAVLMNGLSTFEGPKSVIFLSGGFFTDESWPALQQVVGL